MLGQPPRERSTSLGKVHFDETQAKEHTGDIVIVLSPDRLHADAHLGFLQEQHRYEVQLVLPGYLGDGVVAKTSTGDTANLKVLELNASSDHCRHILRLELITRAHGLSNYEIRLDNEKNQQFVLCISARVLGKGKGTPSLKTGIRCLGRLPEYESDVEKQKK